MFFLNLSLPEFMALLGSLSGVMVALYLLDRLRKKHTPFLFVLAQLFRVGNDAGLDSEGMLAQSFGFGEFADDVPGLFTSQHEFHDTGKMPIHRGGAENLEGSAEFNGTGGGAWSNGLGNLAPGWERFAREKESELRSD